MFQHFKDREPSKVLDLLKKDIRPTQVETDEQAKKIRAGISDYKTNTGENGKVNVEYTIDGKTYKAELGTEPYTDDKGKTLYRLTDNPFAQAPEQENQIIDGVKAEKGLNLIPGIHEFGIDTKWVKGTVSAAVGPQRYAGYLFGNTDDADHIDVDLSKGLKASAEYERVLAEKVKENLDGTALDCHALFAPYGIGFNGSQSDDELQQVCDSIMRSDGDSMYRNTMVTNVQTDRGLARPTVNGSTERLTMNYTGNFDLPTEVVMAWDANDIIKKVNADFKETTLGSMEITCDPTQTDLDVYVADPATTIKDSE